MTGSRPGPFLPRPPSNPSQIAEEILQVIHDPWCCVALSGPSLGQIDGNAGQMGWGEALSSSAASGAALRLWWQQLELPLISGAHR